MAILLSVIIFSQSSGGFEFLRIGAGSRSTAVGDAYTALADDPFGVFYNPAGICKIGSPYFSSFYGRWFMNTTLGGMTGALPVGKESAVGFALKGLYTDRIERRSEEDPWNYSYYNAYFLTPSINYARRFGNLGVGLGLNGIAAKIESSSGYSLFLNSGVIYYSGRFNLGLSFLNVGLKTLNTALPVSIRTGFCLKPTKKLNLVFDFIKPLKDDFIYSYGIEFSPLSQFTLRLGCNNEVFTSNFFKKISGGFGITVGNLLIEYAAVSRGIFGLTHLFTLSYHVIPSKPAEQRFVKERLTSETYLQQGINYYNQGKYDEALTAWDLALIWQPDNQEAIDWTNRLQRELKARNIKLFLDDGRAEFNQGNYLDAIFYFEKVLDLAPGLKEADSLKTEAERRIKEGISSKIKEKTDQGLLAYKKGDYLDAVKFWTEVLKIEPQNSTIKKYIEDANQKMVEEIKDALKKINTYLSQGELKRARRLVEKMLQKYPKQENLMKQKIFVDQKITDKINSHLTKGRNLYNAKDYSKAEKEFQKVLEYDAKNAQALLYLDKIRKELSIGKKEEAERYYLLGIGAYTKNDFALAIEYWQKVLEIDPAYPNAEKNLKRAQLKLRELNR